MKVKNYLYAFFILGLVLLVGCQAEDDSSKKSSVSAEPTEETVRLRINAPSTVQSILVSTVNTDVDTSSFADAFAIPKNHKVVHQDEFASDDGVLLAIQSGTVQVRIYAFSNVIPATATVDNYDLSTAIYFGKSGEETVIQGQEKEIHIDAYQAINVAISDVSVAKGTSNYTISFKTDENLPNVPSTIFHNDNTPDDLDFGKDRNVSTAVSLDGTTHQKSVSSSKTPYFTKIEIESLKGDKYYLGTYKKFCETCEDYPFVIYNRQIAFLNNANVNQGVVRSWKATTDSIASVYFSKNRVDQHFVIRQDTATLARLGIYLHDSVLKQSADVALRTDINPTNITQQTNAPSNFFDNTEVMFVLAKSYSTGYTPTVYFADTADCYEDLSTFGQKCGNGNVPILIVTQVHNNQLIIQGEGALPLEFNIYPQANAPNNVVRRYTLDDNSRPSKWTFSIPYSDLDSNTNYFAQLSNDTYKGNWIEMDVANWSDFSGTTNATVIDTTSTSTTEGELSVKGSSNASIYYSFDVGSSNTYSLDVRRKAVKNGALNNLWDAYVINSQNEVKQSSLRRLAGFSETHPEKFAYTFPESGKYYLKLINPLQESLDYSITLTVTPK